MKEVCKMAYNKQNSNQTQGHKSQIPNWMVQKAKKRRNYVAQEMEQARQRIDKAYHDFLVYLPQSEKVGDGEYATPTGELSELGLYCFKGGVYMSIEKPYLTVDGRVQMLRDEHAATNAKFTIHPPNIIPMNEKLVMTVQIDSEIYGSATGMIEIGIGGKGADYSNPFANAQTSAIGRALGFLGYGLVGTGLIENGDVDDASQEINSQPSQKNNSASKRPIPYRVQVIGDVQINQDGSSTVPVKTVDHKVVTLVLPRTQVEFAQKLLPNAVINVTGWYNEEKARLVVADNSQNAIEKVV